MDRKVSGTTWTALLCRVYRRSADENGDSCCFQEFHSVHLIPSSPLASFKSWEFLLAPINRRPIDRSVKCRNRNSIAETIAHFDLLARDSELKVDAGSAWLLERADVLPGEIGGGWIRLGAEGGKSGAAMRDV
ncbi:hypothetical protein L596_007032 [Steinernema carpocapsae]|uniref:Uncharacterized protein n=1 Tax=Steinernema carpocapsae TaxID=34508 RepID=A0A4U5P7Y9_STECR|nr:hypothetical protein L596_007032 [Steinernema carpocapsae]